MTLPVDNPIAVGDLVENALRTLGTDALGRGITAVIVCLPSGEYFSVESADLSAAELFAEISKEIGDGW